MENVLSLHQIPKNAGRGRRLPTMHQIPERDWKRLRALKESILAEACERIFQDIEQILQTRQGKEHASYLKLWKLLRHEDEDIATMFDDLRRSNATMKLASWRANNLLSDDELQGFTEETQRRIEVILSL
jgi:hypothetical protein